MCSSLSEQTYYVRRTPFGVTLQGVKCWPTSLVCGIVKGILVKRIVDSGKRKSFPSDTPTPGVK
jgi:hypothetical protein